MRRFARLLFPALLGLVLLAQSALSAPAERRVALIIGNGAYRDAPLKNPANDARDMASALKSLGFEVILKENASRRAMGDAIDQFWDSLKKGGTGLFFFAGHGLQVGGENYLVPVDANIKVERDVQDECVSANRVLGRMENAGNGMNIIILDACRNNPFARSFRSADRGLAKMDAPSGSLVAFATAPGDVAADGEGKNGLYTSHLLRHLRTPGLKIEDVLKQVRIGVAQDSVRLGKKQTPWESSSLMGDFYFSGGAQTASLGSSAPTFPPASAVAPPPPLVKPGKGAVDLSDIDKGAQERARAEAERAKSEAAARKGWDARLAAMQGDFAKVQAVEKSPKYAAAERAKAWEKFLAAYPDKNPYSDADKALRDKAQAQQGYWDSVARRDQVEAELAAKDAARMKQLQQLALAPTPKQPPQPAAPLQAPVGRPGQTWRDPVTQMEFVWVPGGSFEMGCGSWAGDCVDNEKPVHSVRLSGFWLGKFEVTQGQWQRVMGNNPAKTSVDENYPVEAVSWNDVKEFISKLNAQGSAKFRLPTEAEWEYAARSGGRPEKYAGGNDIDRLATYTSNKGRQYPQAGTKAPNGLGLYDMSGNVWEWCEDEYASYSASSQDNPLVTGGGPYRVVRGGSWNEGPKDVRSARRGGMPPDFRHGLFGFRLARTN